jgi:hypothetical protein
MGALPTAFNTITIFSVFVVSKDDKVGELICSSVGVVLEVMLMLMLLLSLPLVLSDIL